MSVKYYSIPKDERNTDEIFCQECGRSIVNVIEIDGIPFGTNCALKRMGIKKMTKKRAKRLAWMVGRVEYFISQENWDRADTEANLLISYLGIPDPWNRLTCFGKEYANLVIEIVKG